MQTSFVLFDEGSDAHLKPKIAREENTSLCPRHSGIIGRPASVI